MDDDEATYEQAWLDRDSDEQFDRLLTHEDRLFLYVAAIDCGVPLL